MTTLDEIDAKAKAALEAKNNKLLGSIPHVDFNAVCSPETITQLTADLRACAGALRDLKDECDYVAGHDVDIDTSAAGEALQNLQKNWGING